MRKQEEEQEQEEEDDDDGDDGDDDEQEEHEEEHLRSGDSLTDTDLVLRRTTSLLPLQPNPTVSMPIKEINE